MEDPIMRRQNVPPHVLNKLVDLSDAAEDLNRKVADAERGIAAARTRLTGGFAKDQECHDLRRTLDRLIADKPVLEAKLHRTQRIQSSCKIWLDELPEGTMLEPVKVKANGHDLADVRERIKDAEDELKRLRAVPTPSTDIRKRVENYVQSMARPQITGIEKGQKLQVTWPDGALAVFAQLFPEKVQEVVLAKIDALANDPLPIKERHARIAKLEREIDELAYLEEALVAAAIADGEDVQRSRAAPPQAVLGVRVAETVKSSRAA
jgi:hypothetical protein